MFNGVNEIGHRITLAVGSHIDYFHNRLSYPFPKGNSRRKRDTSFAIRVRPFIGVH